MDSHRKAFAVGAALVVAAVTLGACSQYGVANRSISVNKGLETANNRMLLLNAVRASKRYPMVFSEVTQINTSDPLSGSLSLPLPFGGDAASNFVLTPSINLGSGTRLQISPLDKQKFTRGITTPTSLETLNYYLRQGWPPEMLFSMFIRTMRIKDSCADKVLRLTEKKASAPVECPVLAAGARKMGTTQWRNEPSSDSDWQPFQKFQGVLRDMIRHGLEVRARQITINPGWRETTSVKTVQSTQDLEKKSAMTRTVTTKEKDKPTIRSELFLGYKLPPGQIENRFNCIREQQDDEVQKPCYIEIEASPLRSPEAMIYYMGELIETQVNSENRYLPELKDNERFLRVTRGRPKGASAVKVTHEGETYAIPRDRDEAGRSMQVLSLVSLIFGLHREAEELPSTPTVTLVGE